MSEVEARRPEVREDRASSSSLIKALCGVPPRGQNDAARARNLDPGSQLLEKDDT